ncbi:MAG TPA: penicillin acylase family protein, partial [Longimicrobiaceae bacterium]|nr:penicillin acylase family protein [Longimicrobiaceae bacterium]
QNVVWADTAGHFGYWLCGTVPVRRSGDGVLPTPGWTGEGDWVRFLDFDEHPHVRDPSEGFIVTANNRQIGPEYPFHIGSNFASPYRALRIRQMVEASHDATAAVVARQQMDVRDTHAERYLPVAVRAARAAGDTAATRLLEKWNAEATADSRAAALFYVWYEKLRHGVGDDEYDGKDVFFPRYALDRVLDAGGGAWVDDVRTQRQETLDELSTAAMREAVREVAGRRWGELHSTVMRHALGSVDLLDRTLELNVGPFSNGGSPFTVDVAGYGSRLPFVNDAGPSMRQVVDLSDPDGAGGFVIPTGESGLPFSPHYRDQASLWRTGQLRTLPLDSTRAAKVRYRAVLRP